jgi:hypothetical protein
MKKLNGLFISALNELLLSLEKDNNSLNKYLLVEKIPACNGVPLILNEWFLNYQGIIPLNNELGLFGAILNMKQSLDYFQLEYLGFIEKRLYPITRNSYGDFLLVSLDGNEKSLFFYSPSFFLIEPIIIMESVEFYIIALIECLERSVIIVEENECIVEKAMEMEIFSKRSMRYREYFID